MFNIFNKKKENQPEIEILTIIKSIHKQKSYLYSVQGLVGIQEYEDLRQRPENEQKTIILKLSELAKEFSVRKLKSGKQSWNSNDINYYVPKIAQCIQAGLLRRKLNYNEKEWIDLFKSYEDYAKTLSKYKSYYVLNNFPINYAIKQIEYHLKNNSPSEELLVFIQKILEWEELKNTQNRSYYGSDLNKAVVKLEAILNHNKKKPSFQLNTNDIGPAINAILDSITENRESFDEIFMLATSASSSKPSAKFTKKVAEELEKIGLEKFRKVVHQIFSVPLNFEMQEINTTYNHGGVAYHYTHGEYLCHPSQQFIKGMVWTMERFSDKETIRILSRLCEKTYTKIPGKGPAAASIGNACVYILGNMRGKDGLGALSRLKLKLRQNNIKKTIDKHLVEGAKKYNVSVEELKEMAVPDFQLQKGEKTIAFEDYQLKMFLDGAKLTQQWIKPDGKPMKSVPSLVKNSTSLSKKLANTRKEAKEIQKVFSAQKQRIDNQFILDRSWDFVSFRKYYIGHGLVSPLVEKLIWTFINGDKQTEGIYLDGNWYSVDHKLLDWIDENTIVKLWHPVYADEETIIAWREKIMELEWKQPVKQAFREIYILTDAEINTRTYSNRMAAHILKQHQFNSLANLRDWKYSLMGAFDDGIYNQTCQKHLPEYQITAEYWIDELNQDDAFNDTGIWLYIATDQVKFKDENGDPMDLVNVPKIVFSEIMRDVDMFVGVCSVGNDPLWMDNNGARQTNRDYWTSYSFGDLTEIAKTRKTILERLLPRLKKIRDKAHLDGKFLIVQGKLRTYKIHIGSGNILMEPNDQYLCIVPARSAEKSTDKLFIPFEGDKGLSIVLSKAFLLAEDEKITDSTITSQIGRRS